MKIQTKPDYLVFASAAQIGEREGFPDIIRGWGITLEHTDSKPPLEWMNDTFNRIDKHTLYLLQQGLPEWDSSVLYPMDAVIKYQSTLYIATAENEDVNPTASVTKWKKIFDDIPDGTANQKGIVQSSSATDSDSELTVATSKAVKTAYDLAYIAQPIVGNIQLLPFRTTDLPSKWYFANGDSYPLESEQGRALNSLSAGYKSDWGVRIEGSSICLPNLFNSDGRGAFLRPVNGVSRKVGSIEGDTIRNFTGTTPIILISDPFRHNKYYSGVYSTVGNGWYPLNTLSTQLDPKGPYIEANTTLDLSRQVPVANENRPINIGMIPAIYLGV